LSRKCCLLALFGLVAPACEATYSVPPTPCDHHCNAVQRGECSGDEPADCVRDCEREVGDAVAACLDTRRAVDDCLLDAPRSAFFCFDDHTQKGAICLAERRLHSECVNPGSGACFDECVRRSQVCGDALSDCEEACAWTNRECADVSSKYYTCLRDYPVDCGERASAGAGGATEIPCYWEALELLACGK
jgi:hypothetical protein